MFADALIAPRTVASNYFAIIQVDLRTRTVRSTLTSAHKRGCDEDCRGLFPDGRWSFAIPLQENATVVQE